MATARFFLYSSLLLLATLASLYTFTSVPVRGIRFPTLVAIEIAYKWAESKVPIDLKGEECKRSRRTVRAPKENLWGTLSEDEVLQLIDWLYEPRQGLNLTYHDNATNWDNFIGVTELIPPNKTDALTYLEGNGPIPTRYARVVLFQGACEDPYTYEIKVWYFCIAVSRQFH